MTTDTSHTTISAQDPFIGRVFDGKYEILELLGGGGMGAVYRARHLLLDRTVALKVIHQGAGHHTDPEFLRRFEREAKTTGRLRHPNAVIVHDYGIDNDTPYLVMELVPGQSLKNLLITEGAQPLDRVVAIIKQVSAALDAAHGLGIVHRDLKPDNVMISRGPNGEDWVNVLDFGIAKVLGQDSEATTQVTKTGRIVGTPQYMSPEQIRGKEIDHRSDIYSLAVIAFELLSGKAPFVSSSATDLLVKHATEAPPHLCDIDEALQLPDTVDQVVLAGLSKHPESRPQTAGELARLLGAAASGEPISLGGDGEHQTMQSVSRSAQAGSPKARVSAIAAGYPAPAAAKRSGAPAMVLGLLVVAVLAASTRLDSKNLRRDLGFQQSTDSIPSAVVAPPPAPMQTISGDRSGIPGAALVADVAPQHLVEALSKQQPAPEPLVEAVAPPPAFIAASGLARVQFIMPPSLQIDGMEPTVRLTLHGPADVLRNIDISKLTAVADARGFRPGRARIRIEVTDPLPQGVQLLSKSPEMADVRLEHIPQQGEDRAGPPERQQGRMGGREHGGSYSPPPPPPAPPRGGRGR